MTKSQLIFSQSYVKGLYTKNDFFTFTFFMIASTYEPDKTIATIKREFTELYNWYKDGTLEERYKKEIME